jgi:hypothetical protein
MNFRCMLMSENVLVPVAIDGKNALVRRFGSV